ncbi:TetR/AcrR family transcriptional regulator [Paenibacillus elgii]|uniref:TetR/AcrR family transcriptional regulator n=2 Tax=Paenibacillus elgii TaxID=189691 RepID=UPI002414EA9E|nr:TetR/AcrR family transcriptional regulator [Paenibacillus elgii]
MMARGEKNDPELKKQKIVATALRLFSGKGYHATTTKEIAEEGGVTEGLIFYYFGGKRKLLMHIVNSFSFALLAQDGADRWKRLPLDEALVQYGCQYLQFLKENREYLLLIWSPEMMRDEAVSQEVLRLIGSIGASGSGILKQSAPVGQISEQTYHVAATMLNASILLYFALHSRFSSEMAVLGDEEAYIRQLVGLMLHGLYRGDA